MDDKLLAFTWQVDQREVDGGSLDVHHHLHALGVGVGTFRGMSNNNERLLVPACFHTTLLRQVALFSRNTHPWNLPIPGVPTKRRLLYSGL